VGPVSPFPFLLPGTVRGRFRSPSPPNPFSLRTEERGVFPLAAPPLFFQTTFPPPPEKEDFSSPPLDGTWLEPFSLPPEFFFSSYRKQGAPFPLSSKRRAKRARRRSFPPFPSLPPLFPRDRGRDLFFFFFFFFLRGEINADSLR